MNNKKHIISIICILIVSIFLFNACKDEALLYQNQYLNHFGIEFIKTKHQKVESNKLKDYIYIKLDETEKEEMKKYLVSSDAFYSISENHSDYVQLCKILKNDFSKDVKNVDNGYFSIYNKIAQQIIDSSIGFQNIDTDFFTAIIYDSDDGIVYLFDYNIS